MSLSNVTFCLCVLAIAATLASAPIITTTIIRFTIDFITLSLLSLSSFAFLYKRGMRFHDSSANKHHSQISYGKNLFRRSFKYGVEHAPLTFAFRQRFRKGANVSLPLPSLYK